MAYANSADPDQLLKDQSDQGLHYFKNQLHKKQTFGPKKGYGIKCLKF